MKTKYDEILEKKFKEAYKNNPKNMPGYEDMNYTTDFDIADLMKNNNSKKKREYPRSLKVATILCAILLTSSVMSAVWLSGSVEAGKDLIFDFFNSVTGNEHKISNQSVEFEILDPFDSKEVDKAKDLIPHLFIKDMISNEFTFDNMRVSKISKHDIVASSEYYKSENEIISINQSIISDDHTINIEEYNELESIKGGSLYQLKDPSLNVIYYIKGNSSIEIASESEHIETLKSIFKKEISPNL